MTVVIAPATPQRRADLASLFGPNGAYSNCWCTWWILTGRQFDEATPAQRRQTLFGLVDRGEAPGLLAYEGDEAVGWVAVGPRERYARMMSTRAPVNGPLDLVDPGWVINCFYVPGSHRRQGLAGRLLDAAVDYAFETGATYIAGHPVDTTDRPPPASSLFVGTLTMFLQAGFEEVERRRGRPVVRLDRS